MKTPKVVGSDRIWNEPSELVAGSGVMMVTSRGVEIFTPLYTGAGDQGDESVVVSFVEQRFNKRLLISVPGLCGHYECGGIVAMSMN